jgi:hypothetical protein
MKKCCNLGMLPITISNTKNWNCFNELINGFFVSNVFMSQDFIIVTNRCKLEVQHSLLDFQCEKFGKFVQLVRRWQCFDRF